MEPPDPISALSDDDQLSLWVGRVAREHALLEYGLNNVHRMLAPTDADPVRGSVGPLIDNCRNLLYQAKLSEDLVTACHQALSAAEEASALRNQVVHDMWLDDPLRDKSDQPRWNTFGRLSRGGANYAAATLRDLAAVIDTHAQLVRSRARVSGLFMALHEELPHGSYAETASKKNELPRYIAMMTNQFTLAANGDIEVCGASDRNR